MIGAADVALTLQVARAPADRRVHQGRSVTRVTTSALTHLLAVVGTALCRPPGRPGGLSLVRSGRPDPSGAPTFGLLFLTGVWWTGYSLEIGNSPSFVAATLSLLAPGVALLLLFRLREVRRSLVLLLLTGAAVTLLEEEFAPRAVGVTAAVGTAAIALPQAVRLLRDPAASVADVSLGTWVLLTANAFGVAYLRLPDRSPSARSRRSGAARPRSSSFGARQSAPARPPSCAPSGSRVSQGADCHTRRSEPQAARGTLNAWVAGLAREAVTGRWGDSAVSLWHPSVTSLFFATWQPRVKEGR